MPRVLSLKKANKSPVKNQKSITQFFNKVEFQVPSKTLQIGPEKASAKRKASSIDVDAVIDINENEEKGNYIKKDRSPKKFKKEINSSGIRKNVLESEGMPSKAHYNSTPSLSSLENSKPTSSGREVQFKFSINLEKKREERSSLSPVDNNSISSSITVDTKNKSCNRHANETVNSGKDKTPMKSAVKNEVTEKHPFLRKSGTPKKSSMQEFICTPIKILRTPEKQLMKEISPSKCGSTVKILDLDQQMSDAFGDIFDVGDDFNVADFDEVGIEDLDLSVMQRCEIISITQHPTILELSLKNSNNNKGTCFVEGIWLDLPLNLGEIISVIASRDASGHYCVNNTSGLLSFRPDHLISSTSVVAAVFCKRKALLQERWRGIDSANSAMTIGILIHELVQKALTQNITTVEQLRIAADDIIKDSVHLLYDASLTEEDTRTSIQIYIPPLAEFMNSYIVQKAPTDARVQIQKENWSGHIDKVLDIEENLCCPQLGLKGKIDATLQVTIHDRKAGRQRAIVPLELKSGKASMSAEHRGQLILYSMMLNLQRNEDPTQALQRGLLLYLRDRVDLREVSCGYPERRDLVMLRNQLVQYLAPGPHDIDPEQLTDIEDATVMLQQKLPDPVDHQNACSKCPYLTLCSLHLWHTNGPSVSEIHPLSNLRDVALGHLTQAHIKYFLHWTALLRMEERGQMTVSPIHTLWTDTVEKRIKRGTCASYLILKCVEPSGDRYLHTFKRADRNADSNDGQVSRGPQEGEFSIVSVEKRPWIAAGVVTVSNSKEIHILLERDLSRRFNKDTSYHIDTYESYTTTVQNSTNLGVLMEDSDRAERLRKLIIDKERPQFDNKLPREVSRLGTKLMRSLNIQQQRAVLKALSAKDYALLQGLPGTGKTQTISVLIQMLVALKRRVLVSAHTHSAVDTVLSRLPQSVAVMRLGADARVAPALLPRTETALAAHCDTPDKLAQLYDSMEVVGVTCLGAAHAMLSITVFDVCIIDEATQVLQCTALRPLFAAKRFVLVGDPEQLPPVVRSRAARRLGMEKSLFHRLMHEDSTSTLQLQYRMNQTLVDVANCVAYDSRLKCADQTVAQARLDIRVQKISHVSEQHPWLATACSPDPEHAVLFLDTGDITPDLIDNLIDSKKFCTNSIEACIVVALIETLIQGDVNPSDIGVIAPYRDQVALLRRSLLRYTTEVSTVDQFQGRDKSVIIYSCTKWDKQDEKKNREGEVLNDQRRLAVSVTRAKHKLLVVGNSNVLCRYTPIQRLIENCPSVKLHENIMFSVYNKYKEFVT